MNNNNRRPWGTPKRRRFITKVTSQRIPKSVCAVSPIRIRTKQQILSAPNHNFQMKIRKVFRVYSSQPIALSSPLTVSSVLTRVRNELGITATTTAGELLALHSVHVYSTLPSPGTLTITTAINSLVVQLFDIEETAGTGDPNSSALFEDLASPSGVCSVHAVYPVNNRPTMSRTTADTNILVFAVASLGTAVVIDFDATYIRTPTTVP